jgi:hypothetical protein
MKTVGAFHRCGARSAIAGLTRGVHSCGSAPCRRTRGSHPPPLLKGLDILSHHGTNHPPRFSIISRAARSNCMSSQCFDFARRRGVAVLQISTATHSSRTRKPLKCDFVFSNWLPEALFIYFAVFTYFHTLASFRLSTLWPSKS